MGRKRVFPPLVHTHKGQDRVYWHGAWHYLGVSGSPAAAAEYRRLLAVWAADPLAAPRAAGLTIAELGRDYLASDAVPGPRAYQTGRALDLLNTHHAATPAAEFGPAALAAWQKWLCGLTDSRGRRRCNRSYVLKLVGIVRGMFRWAVATERLAETQYRALLTVDPPRLGEARPPRTVVAADPAHVAAALPFLRPPVRAAVELLILTGARPSEVLRLRPRDVFRGGVVTLPGTGPVDLDAAGVWVAAPPHKTEHHGQPRWVVFGPRAQGVLAPWLDRPPSAYCFSPAEGAAGLHRRVRGAFYPARSLRQALVRACRRAGVPPITPYQLRHRALTEIDLAHGLDAAQAVGGHASPATTRRYARRSFAVAARVAAARG